MQNFTGKFRDGTMQIFGYTFLDPSSTPTDPVPIDLTLYVSCSITYKPPNALPVTVAATINSSPADGVVQSGSILLSGYGLWQAQFVCLDSGGNPLKGEPVQFQILKNEDQAAIDEALQA